MHQGPAPAIPCAFPVQHQSVCFSLHVGVKCSSSGMKIDAEEPSSPGCSSTATCKRLEERRERWISHGVQHTGEGTKHMWHSSARALALPSPLSLVTASPITSPSVSDKALRENGVPGSGEGRGRKGRGAWGGGRAPGAGLSLLPTGCASPVQVGNKSLTGVHSTQRGFPSHLQGHTRSLLLPPSTS